ncbi:hypothetical protein BJF79_37370 [Actinomadura sp. CNU-125]|uniref:hypothetical protein n=1 Tax=Actinomadura sp. CNU-125 TaxID=1904961 RepID=UPI0009693888|nr:hypothetical protein [Actinomadura sp. CNU-125]OLT31370.1 hypothetical protein BJF79_37370 [Actinomadura sp. CNU-125]
MISSHSGRAERGTRPAIFLHVGAAKSGTTYLQQILWHNRHRLREHGVLYPGADQAAHVRAAFDLRHTFFSGASDPSVPGSWRRLVDECRDWGGDAIISQELFAPARMKYVRRALTDLTFADVHVVFTVRDLARQIPAHWQEDVKNRFDVSFAEFLATLKQPDRKAFEMARLFWGLQDPVDVLRRWGGTLPRERVHVVTLPRPGAPRDLLWRRFCEAVRLDPDAYDLAAPFDNPSLGLAETQWLLRLNRALDRELVGWHVHNAEVKLNLAQGVLAARPSPAKTVLPAEHLPWATELAVDTVERLRAARYDVVGDLYELIPMVGPGTAHWLPPAPDPDEPDWAAVADVGLDAIGTLLARLRDAEDRAARTAEPDVPIAERLTEMGAHAAELRDVTAALADEATPPVVRAMREVGDRYPAVRGQLRGAYRLLQDIAARTGENTDTNTR